MENLSQNQRSYGRAGKTLPSSLERKSSLHEHDLTLEASLPFTLTSNVLANKKGNLIGTPLCSGHHVRLSRCYLSICEETRDKHLASGNPDCKWWRQLFFAYS